ncbi:Spindle pole component BBP1 [Nakaseomyces bracarensis]|uniref:Spindle pole component BBP1 n=1 Tax=Nakaseomyces bracarensis TaxID=273131 RepID=A0ABR4NRG3_9SACH
MRETLEDESGGLKGVYRWTMDALFGVSPSAKYVRERYAQDDTNYGKSMQHSRPHAWSQSRSRSNSWSAPIPNERSFNEKYDLLPSISSDPESDIEYTISPDKGMSLHMANNGLDDHLNTGRVLDNVVTNGKLMRPVPVVPRGTTQMGQTRFGQEKKDEFLYRDPTDTFAKRKKNPELSPSYDNGIGNTGFVDDSSTSKVRVNRKDPLIARLFGKEFDSPMRPNKIADLPGKFPSPLKKQNTSVNNNIEQQTFTANDATDKELPKKYMDIFASVDQNNELLGQLGHELNSKRREDVIIDTKYKEKYIAMRNELIKELKLSKKTHDNYYILYNKYKELKTIANDALSLKTTIYQLESEILEQNVSKNREIQELNEKILTLEKSFKELQSSKDVERERYELRIAALEARLKEQQKKENYFSDYSYSHRSNEFSPLNYGPGNYFSKDSDYDSEYPYKNLYR